MVDLTIRGAGVFGLSIGWEAARRGAQVRVIDPGGPGAGASGGVVGALQPHTPDMWNDKKQFQLDSLLMAGAFWSGIEAVSGVSTGFARAGRLQPLREERDVVLARARVKGAAEFWGDAAVWEVVEAEEAGDWRPASASGLYVRDTLSALIHPRRACASLAAAIRARGGDVVEEAPDVGPVIWATGWRGLEELGDALGKPVGTGVKGQAALLKHDAGGRAQIFADGVHIVPHLDGTVAVGSTSERIFDDPVATDGQLDDVIARASELMPVLKGARVMERWAGVRPRAISRAPLLGAWPERAGHFVANGGFKIGFGMAPKVADVMCDLALEGRDGVPEAFRVEASL
jgi:glycine oxidase